MEVMVDKKFWTGKKVLITGHTGFKGSWLSLLLNFLGAKVYGYALKPPTSPSLYELCSINSFVNSTIGDIRDLQSLKRKISECNPDIIIHMAAQPLVRLSYSDPVLTYETNVMGTVNLFEAIRISRPGSLRAVLNVTTDKCYENKEWLWPYRENETLGGYDPYSNSKACSELITSAYRNSFFNTGDYSNHQIGIATARAGNVIGGGDWAKDRLIPDIFRAILNSTPVIIRNPGAIRPWQHVLDPIYGYLLLARELYSNGVEVSGAWNFGPYEKDAKSVEWIVKRLCNKWPDGASFEIIENENFHEATYLKLDSSKARNHLQWKPVWDIEASLDKVLEFMRSYRNHENLLDLCNAQIRRYLNDMK